MSLEDISTLYAEDLAVTADEENVRHPDKICEHTEEIRKLTGEIRVLSQLMAQMMRKIELREGVDGQTVVLLKLQIDRMGADLQDIRKIVAETMPQVEKKRENDSMQIREFVQVVKELKEEISARPNESPTELLQVVKELKEEISARHNEHVQVVKGLKEEISARPNDSPTELLQVVKELKEEMAALRNFPRRNDSHDYQLMFGAGTRHPPSEDSDYMESIVNITSFYPESEEGVKLTNFEEMKIQQDSEVSKGTCSEQLPTDASVEVALAKNEDDSGVITNNTKEDNVKIINCIPETVKDSKFANSQEEMQGELDNGMASKGTELLLANESVEDSPALENRKSVVTNNTKDNVELSTLNPETARGEMQGELDNRMVHKVITESSVQVKESVKDSTAKTVQVKESVEDATAKTVQVKEIVEDAIAKMVQVKESVEDATAKTVQVKENVEDATDKGDGKSVILNKDTDEENDVKLANSQEIILSQLNDKRVEKVAEQLPTKESDEDIEERNQDDSVAITKITENDTFKNSSVCLESEEDAKLAIPQHEMQSKLDGSEVNKVTDKLTTDERKDGDFVVLNENIKEDDDKNISLCPESEDDEKLAYSEQLPTKESVGDAQKKDEKDSVAMTSNIGKDTVDNSSLQRLKTAEDAKLANSQQKMQSKLDAIEQLPTNSGVECVPAKDKDDSVAVTNSTKDDNVKSSSICFERKEDSKLAQQEMQSKLECGGVSEAEIKQLPPTEPVKDAPAAKEDGDSVVNKNNTKDENLKFTSVYQETEEAARLENVQEEMPSKAGNDTKQLIGERYVKDAPTVDDEIGNDDVIKSFSHLKEEDVDFNLAIYHKELQREVNEEVKSQQGYTFNQTDMKHDYIEEVPEIRNPVSSSLDLVEKEGCFESMQHDTKYIDGSLKQIEQGRANEEPHAYVNDGLQGLEEHLTIASREKITNAEFQEKLKNIQEQPKPYTTVSLIPNTKDCMIKSTEENIHMTNANKTCLLEEKYQEKFQAYDVPDVDADIYASTENNLSEKSDESCIKNKQAAPFHSIKTRENVNDEEHPIPIQNVPRTELWYSNYQNCTYFDMEKPPVTHSQEMPNTEYPLDENERKIKELTFESRKKCSHGIISDSVPKLQSINAECISEHPQRTSENYLPHDLDVGSVKNGHQQSNTVRAYKDEYELDPIISKRKQDGSPRLSKIPCPLNSEYQTMLVSNLPKNNKDSYFLGENDKSRLLKTKDLHITDNGINQTGRSQENRKNTVETRERNNGVANQNCVKYRPRNVPGDIYNDFSSVLEKSRQEKSTEWENFPENIMDTMQSDIGTPKYVQEAVRSGISNDRKLRTPNSPKKGYRYNDIQQKLSEISRPCLSPSTNVRLNKVHVIENEPEDQLSQTQKDSEKMGDKTLLNGGKSKQCQSKIPRYQGIKLKDTSSNDEDINDKNNKDLFLDRSVYARSSKKTQTPPNRQDHRLPNGQTNQINKGDIPNMKHEIVMRSSAKSVHADLKTNIVWNESIGKSKDRRGLSGNKSGRYNEIEKGPLVYRRDHYDRFPKHCNEIGSDTKDMNLESDSQYEISENSHQQKMKIDINTTDAVVPQAEDFDVLHRKNYYSSEEDMIGNPIASSTPIIRTLVLEPVATSTPNRERLAEDNSNQVVPSRSYFYDKVMKSDTGTFDFDLKLKCAELFLGKTVIGEIAFQLHRRMIKIVFQQNTTKFMKDLKRDRDYGHAVQSIHYLIMKETLKADGTQDVLGELIYCDRLENLLQHLKKHGYNQKIHEEFTHKMVDKYGTINCRLSRRQVNEYRLEDQEVLEALLYRIAADKSELHNTMVLLNCLRTVVNWDGGNLFIL